MCVCVCVLIAMPGMPLHTSFHHVFDHHFLPFINCHVLFLLSDLLSQNHAHIYIYIHKKNE